LKAKNRKCIKASLLRCISKTMFSTAEFPVKHNCTFGTTRTIKMDVAILDHCFGSTSVMVPIIGSSFVVAANSRAGAIKKVHF